MRIINRKKGYMKNIYLAALCLFILIAAMPNILSTQAGQKWLRNLVFKQSEGKVSFQDCHLSWFGPQFFTHFSYSFSQQEEPLVFDELFLNHSLISVLVASISVPKINKNNGNLNFSWKAKELYTAQICQVLECDHFLQKKLLAIAGPKIESEGSVQFAGKQATFKLIARNQQMSANINGEIIQGVLKLTEKLTAQINATPDFTREILQPLLPLLNPSLYSQNQVRINIENDPNFSFPIDKFRIQNVSIPQAMIDIGKVQLTSSEGLSSLLKVLNLGNKENGKGSIDLWLTPIYFHINQGLITLERVDVLVWEQYPMAIWGQIDLINDRLQMTLGLTKKILGKTLSSLLLSKNSNMLPLPVEGTVKKPSINLQMLTNQLGGKVLSHLFTDKEQERIPSPTTTPLPWEKNFNH